MTHLTNLETTLIKTINNLITADFWNFWEGYSAEIITKKMLTKYDCLKEFVVGKDKIVWVFKERKCIYYEDFPSNGFREYIRSSY